MVKDLTKTITVHISEQQTIVELSKSIQSFRSEIFLQKMVQGNVFNVNIKSFLGLITLQLKNGDKLTVRAIGEDSEKALATVVEFLT